MLPANRTPLIGRDDEAGAVDAFVAAIDGPPAALVIAAEPGMGKTLVWQHAVDLARGQGATVLVARAVERELDLPYAVLADLIGPLFAAHRSALPDPQRAALSAVLLEADPGVPLDVRAVGTAVVGVLGEAAMTNPVLIAIDDEPWIDAASRDALGFAIRRLPGRTRLLVTRRTPDDAASSALDAALPRESRSRIDLRPLSAATLHEVLAVRLGTAPTRPVLTRIADVSMGNPFFALELARAAAADPADRSASLDPLAVPRSLRDTVARRLQSLTEPARAVLTVVAALAQPTPELIEAAVRVEGARGPGGATGATDASDAATANSTGDEIGGLERAGLLVVDDTVRISHPLIAEILLDDLGPAPRRELHRRLATTVTDHDEIARHLALGTVAPDPETARRIEAAAERIARRGATLVAAELAAAAVRLTLADDATPLARRLTTEGRLRLSLGEVGRARELVEQAELVASVRTAVEPDAARAELLADLAWADGRLTVARDGLREALAWAADPSVRARIGARLVGLQVAVEPAGVASVADSVLAIVDPTAEPGIAGYVRINRFFGAVVAGRSPDLAMLEEGLRLEAAGLAGLARGPISSIPLIWLNAIDDADAARARHELEDGWYRDRGEDGWRAERQAHRALTELRAGDWDRAELEIEASCARIEAFEAPASWPTPFGWRALIDAHRGRDARARSTIEPLIATADRQQNRQWAGLLWSVSAFIAFAAGDAAATDRAVGEMHTRFDEIGFREALGDRSEPLHVEVLLELGQVDRAAEAVARLATRGRTVPRPWIDLGLARAEALLLADTGHLEDGVERLAAVDPSLATRLPFDGAWNELVRGRLLRRGGHRRDAAAALSAALAVFDGLGATPWARRARSELDRVGLRRGDPLALTATERRIAELAAAGLTNREVAATAFVSAKTVEANLARVYGKLGIRSRAELGARMGPPSTDGGPTQT